VSAPSEQQGIVRLDLEPARERGDSFAKLPGAGLRNAEVDDFGDVARVSRKRRLALVNASVSGSERYSTPDGERYCTD
jgi:hypothetical protein